MALVKYNNNSISAVTSAASIPSGALTHIKTLTASSSSTLSFEDGSSDVVLDSTYPIYVFKFINIHGSDNQQLGFQANASGGSGYNETVTNTYFRAFHAEADNSASLSYDTGRDQAQGSDFIQIISDFGGDNDSCGVGTLYLFNPASTTFVKHFMVTSSNHARSNAARNMFIGGYFNTTSAIDEIQFKMDSGNIDAGKIKLYGIKDS